MKYRYKIFMIFTMYLFCLACSNQRKIIECPINLSDFKVVQDPQKVIAGLKTLKIYDDCTHGQAVEIFGSDGRWSYQEDGATSLFFEGIWKAEDNKVVIISEEFGVVYRLLYVNSEDYFHINSIRDETRHQKSSNASKN
jgi:hypothetical protein